MRRAASSIDEILREAMEGVVARATRSIQQAIEARVAAGLKEAKPARGRRGAPASARRRRPARQPRKEMTRWIADRRARRVPNFVIEATGLDTKKKIVARFGADAVFQKGKALPAGAKEPKKARAPVVRKAAAAR